MGRHNQLDSQALHMQIKQRQRLQSLRVDIRAGFAAVRRGEYTDYDATSIERLQGA